MRQLFVSSILFNFLQIFCNQNFAPDLQQHIACNFNPQVWQQAARSGPSDEKIMKSLAKSATSTFHSKNGAEYCESFQIKRKTNKFVLILLKEATNSESCDCLII